MGREQYDRTWAYGLTKFLVDRGLLNVGEAGWFCIEWASRQDQSDPPSLHEVLKNMGLDPAVIVLIEQAVKDNEHNTKIAEKAKFQYNDQPGVHATALADLTCQVAEELGRDMDQSHPTRRRQQGQPRGGEKYADACAKRVPWQVIKCQKHKARANAAYESEVEGVQPFCKPAVIIRTPKQ